MTLRTSPALGALAPLLLIFACGDDPPPASEGGQDSSGAPSDSSGTTPPPATGNVTATGQGTGQATGTETGNPPADSSDAEDDDESAGPPIFLDVGGIPDMPPPVCGGAGTGDLSLSYIWIANSSQGTISKIDTATMVEEGRYQARPASGDPSRTSVNLAGDVAVANRNGGVAKFWADQDDCQDSNGVPGIQTSSGGGDILPWEDDDCLAWYTPFTCSSNRPVAWTRGTFNEATCAFEDMDLWTVCDNSVHLLDGETGAIEETIPVPAGGFGGSGFVYGGAADADGNFWGLDTGRNQLFRVEFGSFDTEAWGLPPNGGYGITVDSIGRPWVCGGGSVSRFDLDSSTWDSAGFGGGIGGCQSDGDQLIWHSDGGNQILGFNIETLAIDEQLVVPDYVHGISIDFQGNVWGVTFAGNEAYRANPDTGAVDTFAGLFGAYTYSDMTGHALSTAGGGGVPTD